jgi:hypothetical protein
MSRSNPPSLRDHIIATYGSLRNGIGLLSIALPILLAGIGYFKYGLILQNSISAYYHAFVTTQQFPDILAVAGNGVMRNWFVGILWAIGFFLILYKGYGRRENNALNLAGILLIIVAMFPMDWKCGEACPKVSVHGIAAILFFLSIGYVCIFRSGDTLKLVKDLNDRESYLRWYRRIGAVMWAFPLVVTLLEFFKLHPFGSRTVFFIEVAGIWAFAAYWLIKSREIAVTNADSEIVQNKLSRPARKPGIIGYWLDTTPLKD